MISILDQMEGGFAKDGISIVAVYDHLDRIGSFNRDHRHRYIGALLALWLSLSNRYKHIRCKIFLRDDLFDYQLRFADASKLDCLVKTRRPSLVATRSAASSSLAQMVGWWPVPDSWIISIPWPTVVRTAFKMIDTERAVA